MSAAPRCLVSRLFRRALRSLPGADFIYAEIRGRLLERLELVRLEPSVIVDLGAGTGGAVAALGARFPQARILALDLVPEVLQAGTAARSVSICADATRLPLRDASVDLVFCNLMLPWCPARAVFAEARRVLRFPGLFSFSTVGPDTLRELRQAWAAADRFQHVQDFEDMHNLGDALVHGDFAEPVLDSEILTLTYPDVNSLAAELRAMGASNLGAGRNRGLTGRRAWSRMAAAYDTWRRADGRLPLTVEVIYGQAWIPAPRGANRHPPEFAVPIARIGRRRA